MPFFFLAILLSSRAVNSGPLNFGDSTFSEPDEFSILDGGQTANTGKVIEFSLLSSQSNQFDAFSNKKANILPGSQISGSTNDASPSLLADLPIAACPDSDSRVKSSAQKNEDLCPPYLETSPARQSTEKVRQQQDSRNNFNPDEEKDHQSVMSPEPPDDICTPPKKLFCCFGREVENWNSREGCEYFTTLEECHMQGGFPFCCIISVGAINAAQVAMVNLGIGCDQDPVTGDKFLPPNNIIQFPTFPANVIPLIRGRPRPQPPPPDNPNPPP